MIRIIASIATIVRGRTATSTGVCFRSISWTRTVTTSNIFAITRCIAFIFYAFITPIRRNASILVYCRTITFRYIAVIMSTIFIKNFRCWTSVCFVIKLISVFINSFNTQRLIAFKFQIRILPIWQEGCCRICSFEHQR